MVDKSANSEIMIRRLRADDVTLFREVRLAALEDSPDAFGETLDSARTSNWHTRAADGSERSDRAVYVAVVESLPIGMVFVRCATPSEPAFVGGMWVKPEFRRGGVGRSLLESAFAFLRAAGQSELSLWVTHGHDDVFAFYYSLGFRDTGVTSTLRPGSEITIHELRGALS